MSRKWTSWPWTVPHFARPDVGCDCGYVLCSDRMGAVATVHCSGVRVSDVYMGDNPNFDEAVANAYLIAAAPELYEALHDLALFCAGRLPAEDLGSPVMEAASAAIRKARGEK